MTDPRVSPRRHRLATTAHLVLVAVIVVLVLVQAVLAGQAQFGGHDIALHGHIGNVTFAAAVCAAALAGVSRLPRLVVLGSGLLLLLLFVQTGLGYVGRTRLTAAAWHVPLGVLVFGLATALLAALLLERGRAAALRGPGRG